MSQPGLRVIQRIITAKVKWARMLHTRKERSQAVLKYAPY